MERSMLSEQQLETLAKELERAISQTEPNFQPQEIFQNAIFTVENLDKATRGQGFPVPSEAVVRDRKIKILNSLCIVVGEVWEQQEDGSELQALGEKALNLVFDELELLGGAQ